MRTATCSGWSNCPCYRPESFPNFNFAKLFDELCSQFPGHLTRRQPKSLLWRVNRRRLDARDRGMAIGTKTYRRPDPAPRGTRLSPFALHGPEKLQCPEGQLDQTALELLIEFGARYPDRHTLKSLRPLQRRLRVWRREAMQRLTWERTEVTQDVTTTSC